MIKTVFIYCNSDFWPKIWYKKSTKSSCHNSDFFNWIDIYKNQNFEEKKSQLPVNTFYFVFSGANKLLCQLWCAPGFKWQFSHFKWTTLTDRVCFNQTKSNCAQTLRMRSHVYSWVKEKSLSLWLCVCTNLAGLLGFWFDANEHVELFH